MFYCGGKTSEISFLMPFLLIAIGIDDVFVICNAPSKGQGHTSALNLHLKATNRLTTGCRKESAETI